MRTVEERLEAGLKGALRNGTFDSALDALRLSHEEWFAILKTADNELLRALQERFAILKMVDDEQFTIYFLKYILKTACNELLRALQDYLEDYLAKNLDLSVLD